MRVGESLAVLACVLVAAIYAFTQGTYFLSLFANVGLVTYMALAVATGIVVFFKLGRSKMTYISVGFSLGLLSWALGLVIYTYAYYVVNTGLPNVSWADFFYLLEYVPMIVGAVGLLRICSGAVGKRGWAAVVVSGLVLYSLDFIYIIPPSIATLTAPLDIIVSILYPTLDITVFLILFPIFLAMRKGVFAKAFGFISLGMVLLALGDLAYGVLSLASLYYDGNPIDLLLFFGCVSAGYGFWLQYADLRAI
jgi:hypothetical protein